MYLHVTYIHELPKSPQELGMLLASLIIDSFSSMAFHSVYSVHSRPKCLDPKLWSVRHLYADDTQVYGWCHPADVDVFSAQLTACTHDVASCMQSNRLQLNCDKTKVLWCATTICQHQLPKSPLSVDGTLINPVQSVRDLGIFIDANLVMCKERSLGALPFSGSCAQFAIQYQRLRYRLQ